MDQEEAEALKALADGFQELAGQIVGMQVAMLALIRALDGKGGFAVGDFVAVVRGIQQDMTPEDLDRPEGRFLTRLIDTLGAGPMSKEDLN